MTQLQKLALKMAEYEYGSADADGSRARVPHLLKVHSYAALIGSMEGLDPETQLTLETAALVHDIGIRPALEQYGSSAGPYQEKLGQEPARAMLRELGFDEVRIDRVAWLVGHHHTYDPIDGIDHQILVEADFLVNLHEKGERDEVIRNVKEKIFRTASGRHLLEMIFGI